MAQPQPPVPRISSSRCTGCGLCVAVCPNNALGMDGRLAYVAHPDRCNYTGYCELICPTQAIERPFEIVDRAKDGKRPAEEE